MVDIVSTEGAKTNGGHCVHQEILNKEKRV